MDWDWVRKYAKMAGAFDGSLASIGVKPLERPNWQKKTTTTAAREEAAAVNVGLEDIRPTTSVERHRTADTRSGFTRAAE